jgi:hypothetical protein
MTDPARTMIDNLPAKTGRSLQEWFTVLDATGLQQHGELMAVLKSEHGLTHGFANGIVLRYRAQGTSDTPDDLVAAQYAGPKAGLRPVLDAVVTAVTGFGPDVEVVPKKTAVSLRRSKQFAVIEVPSAKRVQLGIQLKGVEPTGRLLVGNQMCSHKVVLTAPADVDGEVVGWLREAYERS